MDILQKAGATIISVAICIDQSTDYSLESSEHFGSRKPNEVLGFWMGSTV